MQPTPTIPTTQPKPKGFDPGLQCLTAVFVFTLIVRVTLTFVNRAHSIPLIKLALTGVMVGLTAIFVTSFIVWSRRNESQRPPRRWAVITAMVWVSLQL